MANARLVDILDARNELEVELASLLLGKSGVPDDIIEQLTAIAVLHDHVQFLFGLNNLVQLNHVRVSHLLQNLDFSSDAFNVFLVVDLVLLQNFDGNLNWSNQFTTYLLASQSMLTELYLAECSLAKVFA